MSAHALRWATACNSASAKVNYAWRHGFHIHALSLTGKVNIYRGVIVTDDLIITTFVMI